MKKTLTMILTMLMFGVCMSQNGGQANENNVVKISFTGYNATEYYFKVTSKQNCNADYKISYTNLDSVITLPPLGSTTIEVEIHSGVVFKAKAVQGTTCTSQPDMGWVEIVGLIALPISTNPLATPPRRNNVVMIYPNPSTTSLNIQGRTDFKRPLRVDIVDMMGALRKSVTSFQYQFSIDVSDLIKGAFILKMYDGNGMVLQTSSLIKQ